MKTFYLNKTNGRVTNKTIIAKNINELEDGRYQVEIRSTKSRSLQQNAWLHAILPDIVQGLQDVGYTEIKTTDQAKAVIKALFFKKQITNGIETIEIIEGTSDTSKFDFSSKTEEIIDWAAQYLGIQIAPPSSQVGLYDVSYTAERENNLTIVKK